MFFFFLRGCEVFVQASLRLFPWRRLNRRHHCVHRKPWRQLPHILHTGHTQCVNVQPHTRYTRMEACWDRLAGNGSGLGHVNTVHGRFPLPPYAPNGQDMRMRTIKIQIFDGKTLSAKLRWLYILFFWDWPAPVPLYLLFVALKR